MQETKSRTGLMIAGLVLAIILVSVGVFAISQRAEAPQQPASSEPTNTRAADPDSENVPVASERILITFTDEGFTPKEVTVKKGMTVAIENNSSKSVQFSSDEHPSHRKNEEMNLKALSPREATSYKATQVGRWTYHDHIDESHTGVVIVEE